MPDQLYARVTPLLNQLSRFLCFKRKLVAQELTESILIADKQITQLQECERELTAQCQSLENELKEAKKNFGLMNVLLNPRSIRVDGRWDDIASWLEHDLPGELSKVGCPLLSALGFYKKLAAYLNDYMMVQPVLRNKIIVSVMGAPGAGKTRFVNNLIGNAEAVSLPEGIVPTTCIPTCVVDDSCSGDTVGYVKQGGEVDLTHELIESFTQDNLDRSGMYVRSYLSLISISARLKMVNKKIALIDCPGWDADAGSLSDKHLEMSHGLIWLIDIVNGTIPKDQINFLTRLQEQRCKVHVVLTKSDLRPAEEANGVLENVSEILDRHDIATLGVSVCDGNGGEVFYKGKCLEESWNDFCETEPKRHHQDEVLCAFDDLLESLKPQNLTKDVPDDVQHHSDDFDEMSRQEPKKYPNNRDGQAEIGLRHPFIYSQYLLPWISTTLMKLKPDFEVAASDAVEENEDESQPIGDKALEPAIVNGKHLDSPDESDILEKIRSEGHERIKAFFCAGAGA